MMNGMEWNVKELPAFNVVLNALSVIEHLLQSRKTVMIVLPEDLGSMGGRFHYT